MMANRVSDDGLGKAFNDSFSEWINAVHGIMSKKVGEIDIKNRTLQDICGLLSGIEKLTSQQKYQNIMDLAAEIDFF